MGIFGCGPIPPPPFLEKALAPVQHTTVSVNRDQVVLLDPKVLVVVLDLL